MRQSQPLLLALCLFARLPCSAQSAEKVSSWWPDTVQNLMWSGSTVGGPSSTQNFKKAQESCKNLAIQNYTGWRLPTIDELDHIVDTETYNIISIHRDGPHTESQVAGSGISFTNIYGAWIWSSTPGKNGDILAERHGLVGHAESSPTTSFKHQVLCVRPLEPEIAALAKQVKPQYSIANLLQLQTLAPLRISFDQYKAGNYTVSLASAQAALAISAQYPEALYARGLNEAALGNWQQALTDFETVKKLKWVSMSYPISWAEAEVKGKPLNPKKTGPQSGTGTTNRIHLSGGDGCPDHELVG